MNSISEIRIAGKSYDNGAGHDLDDINELFRDSHPAPKPPPAPQRMFQPLTLADLLAMPPKSWIIDQVIGAGDIGMIYGPPGTGKTFVVVDLIFAACLGSQWAMRFNVAKPLNIAYAAGEGVSGLPQRFTAAAAHYGVSGLPNFTFFATTPALYYDAKQAAQIESIERFILEWQDRQAAGQAQPLDILVIDTLHSATSGADENSAQDMGVVLNLCKQATKLLGCAVLLVHHTNKAGTGERGSSALRGAMDVMIGVSPAGGKFAMNCEKLKDGEQWKPQAFDLVESFDSVRVWWNEPSAEAAKKSPSAALLDLLKEHSNTKFTAKQLAEPLSQSQSGVIQILNRLHENGVIKRELHEIEKPPSSRNPWVYFLDK